MKATLTECLAEYQALKIPNEDLLKKKSKSERNLK